MAMYVLMALLVVGMVVWQLSGLPRWMRRAGMVLCLLVSLYFALVLIHAWRMIRP